MSCPGGLRRLAAEPGVRLLCLTGAVWGYFFQANWAWLHKEPLGWPRLILGGAAIALALPSLGIVLGALLERLWGRSRRQFLACLGPVTAASAGVWLCLGYPQWSNGVLALTVICAVAAGLLAAWLRPGAGAALLMVLVFLAASGVYQHGQHTRYYDRASMERVLKGNADAPIRYRLLVPWAAQGLADALDVKPDEAVFGLRALANLAIFLVSARVLGLWVRGPWVWSGALLYLILAPFSYYFRYNTDEVEILGAWVLLWCAAWSGLKPLRRQVYAVITMLVFALNRETVLLLGPWFLALSLSRDGWGLKNPAWYAAAVMVLGVLAEQLLLVMAYGGDFQPNDYLTEENLGLLRQWLERIGPARRPAPWMESLSVLFVFCSGCWLVAAVFWRRLPKALSWGVAINFPWLILVQTFLGRYLETRQLYLLLPFVVGPLAVLLAQDEASAPVEPTGSPRAGDPA